MHAEDRGSACRRSGRRTAGRRASNKIVPLFCAQIAVTSGLMAAAVCSWCSSSAVNDGWSLEVATKEEGGSGVDWKQFGMGRGWESGFTGGHPSNAGAWAAVTTSNPSVRLSGPPSGSDASSSRSDLTCPRNYALTLYSLYIRNC